ncbi:threonine--tRNA ligase [Candidatus Calescamantes bacterium]|nr:threonine--tRNA ligase [Candidatus Calescamantes bacterium]
MNEKKVDELEILRHSASHILAQAVKRLFPEARLGIGPPIKDGFYYDFDVPRPFTPEDLEKIEEEMRKIVEEDFPFIKKVVPKEEAKRFFREKGEKYKLELLEEIPAQEVSLYEDGEFVDLCRGPHVKSTGEVKYFKLLSVAGAYWRGDEKNPMLQRIYGTAFFSQEELEDYLRKLEEAKKRDHRVVGKELDLFSLQEEAGAGLIFWHPKGAVIRRVIEEFWYEEHRKRGYQIVYTPHIMRKELWVRSGHWEFYRENMFPPMELPEAEYILKPMNCPGHILIYKSKKRSYRDLPLRFAEMGTVYRYEKSGVLHGMLRVRGFTQDDAHIFCTPSQVKEEIEGVIDFIDYMMKIFKFPYRAFLSTRPEKYAGELEDWDRAENTLKEVLESKGIKYEIEEGEGVFYGPKIDIKMEDALGRLWQGPTVQFDFNLPRKFEVTYVGEDGKEHYVVMIHRVVLGAMERFVGTLIEFYGGDLPFWLAPLQVRVLPVSETYLPYAEKVYKTLFDEGIRVEIDRRDATLGYKIRDGELKKVPYLVVVGKKEEETGKVAVRERKKGQRVMELKELVEELKLKIKEKN